MAENVEDSGSVRGRGSDILLPPSGNPFNPEARPTDLIPNYPAAKVPGAEPATDDDVAPGLPAWTEAGDPRTPGTAHYEPPPDGAPPVIAPSVSAVEDGGPTTTAPASLASKEAALATALLVDRLGDAAEPAPVSPIAPAAASPGLPANARLARLLAPDQDLQRLWNEVNSLERALVERQRISLAVARELLTLLQSARNRLLNARDHYEEAARDVAEVRFRLLRWDQVKLWEQPRFLWWYLVLHVPFLIVAAIAPIALPDLFAEVAARVMRFEGLQMMDPVVLWMTIVSGGFGGIVGAAYNLFKHTSQVKDYDPDYAYWYLLYAPVGMLLAVAVFLIGRSGLILGVQ
ncbi:MAG TPA: hypothetical protein PK954_00490, partial [Anaerolineales bacterium]|nr:hypothetical protein [Anaerolineales bacterium]